MAFIRDLGTGRVRPLEAEHLVGRALACSLWIDARYVSSQHAVFRWTGSRWEIKDLGSRNGTFLDGNRLKPGDEHLLHRGSRLAFGHPEQQWELTDTSAPVAMVVPLDGEEPILLDGELVALPSNEDPRVTIYRDEGTWVLERPDESLSRVANLQTFHIDGRTFRFCHPENVNKTSLADAAAPGPTVQHLELAFSVSSDEEHVHLQMNCGGDAHDMGARGHNYLLLTLARQRLSDAAQGMPEASCGWIYQEDLAHDPSMAPPQLNIDVFRIRKQFAALGVVDAANIVERRPRTRQLRIGTGHISVVRV